MNRSICAGATVLALVLAASPALASHRYVPHRRIEAPPPLVHVHWVPNVNEGGGSWASSAGGMNPIVVAKAPSPAASTLTWLEYGDGVCFDGTVPNCWFSKPKPRPWNYAETYVLVSVERVDGSVVSLYLEGTP